MTNIKLVAKISGVSVATVSRVLNNSESVSTKTFEKVTKVIEELGYSPNVLGRNLRKNKTMNILVLLPSLSNSFYSKVIAGIENVAKENNYKIMIANTKLDPKQEQKYLDMLTTKQFDGLILLASSQTKQKLDYLSKNYPIIQCCEYIHNTKTSIVSIDNYQAGFDATKYLIKLGHKKIGLVSNEKYLSATQREKGFIDALKKHDIEVNKDYIFHCDYSLEQSQKIADKISNYKNMPTAIFTISDQIAIGLISKLTQNGISVPKDISVMGFDNTNICNIYNPTITTVSQPQFEIGKKSMELLIQKIQDINIKDKQIFLNHNLVIRNSTINLC